MPSPRLRLAVVYAVLSGFALSPSGASAQFPITQSFTGASATGWTLLGSAVLTANGYGDSEGNGWLRLTDATADKAGTAYYDTAFPSTDGIVVTFDYADYGGNGADGFSVFLIDGATSTPTVGSSGGPLGYAAKVDSATTDACASGPQTVRTPTTTYRGVTNGFVGIGFDEYGNFSNCESGYNSPGLRPQAVAIRGSGTSGTGSQTAFRYLTGTTVTPAFTIDGVQRTAFRRVRVSIINQRIKVEMDLTGTGNGYQTVISGYDLSTAPGQVAMPATFKLGISGSTGGSTNTHEIRNVRIEKPVNLTLSQTTTPSGSILVGQVLTYTITVANDATNDATGTVISDPFPGGLSGVAWTCTATGGASLPVMFGSGNLSASATLPKSSSLTCTVTGTVAAGALGTTLTNVVNVSPPAGSANLLSSTANTAVVVAYPTATTLASSAPSTVYGQPTTLTATTTVTSGSSTPAGTVTFYDGATALGTSPVNGAGVATLSVNTLAVGSHALTAQFTGTSAYWPSTSAAVTQTVSKASTTTAVVTSATPVLVGQPVTFTATVAAVAPGGFVPTGTVTFLDGAASLGTGTLDGSGVATLTTSALALGAHTVTARFDGSASHLGSTSSSLTQTVTIASTTTALASSANPTVYGQAVVLSATVASVAPAGGTPTGTVRFYEGATLLGSASLGAGVAQLTLTAPTVGSHGYAAVYAGTADYNGSTSAGLTQTVNAAATTTSLASGTNPSVTGQSVTFTATVAPVAPGGGVPSGTVQLREGATVLASGSLSGGTVTFTLANLGVATHPLTAAYAGSTSHAASTSGALSQVVNKAATGTAVAGSPAPSVYGQSVTFTATVTATAPGAGTPTGTVTFAEGATTLAARTLSGGAASFSTTALGAGSHTITATYGGDAAFSGGSGTASQTVNTAATTTALAASPAPSVFGQAVTLTATVTTTAPGAGTAGGTVTFRDGATSLGTSTLNGSGVATLVTSALAAGARSLTAVYGGDANHAGSTSAALSQTVDPAATATALAASPAPSVFGQAVTLTATVTTTAPGAGTPDGTVTFLEGSTTLGTATLAAGEATLTLSGFAPGAHTVVAQYGGSARFAASSSPGLAQTVNAAATTTTLAAAPSPAGFGQLVTLTATVAASAPGAGTPAGTVTFSDGAATLGTATLSGGVATLTTSALAVGPHGLAAAYAATASHQASTSATTSLTVNQATTTTTLAAAPTPSVVGQAVTLGATVTAGSGGTPGGTVTFRDGATVVGSASLDAGGHAVVITSSLGAGAHSLTASYGGAASFAGSTSAAVGHTVGASPSATALVAGPSPALFGEPVELVATVTAAGAGAGIPAGLVEFTAGAASLGVVALDAGGLARLSVSTLAVGGHALAAAYQGTAAFQASASAAAAVEVVQAATTVALSSSLPTSTFGDEVTLTVTVAPVAPGAGLPSGTVTFLVDGAPVGTASLAGGVATLRTTSLPAGVLGVTAAYAGDASFAGATSESLLQSVSKATTTVTLASSANPVELGEPLTLTAAVSSGAGTPAGTVTFRDGATVLCLDVPVVAGAATCAPALGVGTRSLTAAASGDGDHAAATSAALAQVVSLATSTTTLAAAPAAAVAGQPVTLSATVSAAGAGAGTPTGTVTFQEGATTLGSAPLDAAGVARLDLSSPVVGGHAVTAAFAGDARYQASTSAAASFTVAVAATTTALAASVPAPEAGQPFTLTATVAVTAPGAATPGGTVTFRDGAGALGAASVGADGVATLVVPGLPAGAHTLGADYGGDAHLAASSAAPLAMNVASAGTATTLAAAATPVVYGQPAALTVQVTVIGAGSGTPSGAVTVEEGAAVLGTGTLDAGAAVVTLTGLEPGAHALVARFPGDGQLGSSVSAVLTLTVNPAATVVTLDAPASPVAHGAEVTLTAAVAALAPGGGVPAGTVTFSDGSAVLGVAALDGAGRATLVTAGLTPGAHTLTAAYAGSARHRASTAAEVLTVEHEPVTVSVASSRNPSRHGLPVTFTVSVTSAGGTPDGAVTLRDGDATLAELTLAGGTATFTTRDLTRGTHAVTAAYAGSAIFAAADGSLPGGQVVENAPPVAGAGTALALGPGAALRAALGAPAADDPARGAVELWLRAGWSDPAEVGALPSILTLGSAEAPRLALGLAPDRRSLAVTVGAIRTDVAAALDDGRWHHLAVSSDGEATQVLLDAVPVASLSGGLGAGAPGTLTVGDGFAGAIDELRIWTGARSAAELEARRWRILAGDEPGLAALWRFDEGSGAEAFDAGPAHLEGTLDLVEGDEGFTPSAAWARRALPADHSLVLDAGYDPDGDPLNITLGDAPALGRLAWDGDRDLRFDAPEQGQGLAELSWTVDDGAASASAAVEVEVLGALVCETVSVCPSGDLCLAGVCTSPEKVVARSGAGCGAGATGSSAPWLALALLALALPRLRRARAARAASRIGVALALLLAGAAARAQTPEGFALQTLEPPPPGDRFFSLPDAATAGHLRPALALTGTWTDRPLVLKSGGHEVPGGHIVDRSLWIWAQGSLTLLDRVVVDAAIPVALAQGGDRPLSGLSRVSASSFGDLRLGARAGLRLPLPVDTALGLDLWIPTGKRDGFSSDGAARALPKVLASGEVGRVSFAAELGLLVRRNEDLGVLTRTGSAFHYAAGVAYRFGDLQVGPELFGRKQFKGTATSPAEALLGVRWRIADVRLGAAVGTALNDAPGAAPLRVVAGITWQPSGTTR